MKKIKTLAANGNGNIRCLATSALMLGTALALWFY